MVVLDVVLNAAAEVFHRPVTEKDEFFALGGDSLLAVEMVLAIEAAIAVEVEPSLLFETGTFGELATEISALVGTAAATTVR